MDFLVEIVATLTIFLPGILFYALLQARARMLERIVLERLAKAYADDEVLYTSRLWTHLTGERQVGCAEWELRSLLKQLCRQGYVQVEHTESLFGRNGQAIEYFQLSELGRVYVRQRGISLEPIPGRD